MNEWDRAIGESASAHSAFRAFLDLGQNRSISEAYRKHSGRTDAAKAPGRWNDWARRFNWELRARAYDLHLARFQQQEAEKQAIAEQQQWLRRQGETRKEGWRIAEALHEKAKQMLTFPVIRTTRDIVEEERRDESGRVIQVTINRTIIEPAKWDFSAMTRMFEISLKLMRLSAGMPTDHTESDTVTVDASPEMSQEEIDNRVLELLERARARAEAAKKDEPEKPN